MDRSAALRGNGRLGRALRPFWERTSRKARSDQERANQAGHRARRLKSVPPRVECFAQSLRGDGRAAGRIIAFLKSLQDRPRLLRKGDRSTPTARPHLGHPFKALPAKH